MKKRILCFGDSNTWGYIPVTKQRYEELERWPGILAEKLGDTYAVIEEGMNGRTTAFTDRIKPDVCALDYIYPCLLSQFPLDYIIVMLGTNDTKDRYHVRAEEIALGMTEVILRLKDVCMRKEQRPQILIMSPPMMHFQHDWMEFSEASVEKLSRLHREYQQIAQVQKCEYLNAAEVVGNDGVGSDGIHMLPLGHQRLAEAVYNKLFEQ